MCFVDSESLRLAQLSRRGLLGAGGGLKSGIGSLKEWTIGEYFGPWYRSWNKSANPSLMTNTCCAMANILDCIHPAKRRCRL